MKKSLLPLLFFGSFALAQSNLVSSQTLADATLKSNGKKKTLIEKIKEKELELQVPRETVPVEAINYPIKTPIPKTAEYLPMLQTLLHIESGTLPNPIGVSIIGSFTQEQYRINKFYATLGPGLSNIGTGLSDNLDKFLTQIQSSTIGSFLTNGTLFGKKIPVVRPQGGLLWVGSSNDATTNRTEFFDNLKKRENDLNNALPIGLNEWEIQDGSVKTKTSAIGFKADMWLFPFMQLFGGVTYLHMEQETHIGTITIPLQQPITISDYITGSLKNILIKANGGSDQVTKIPIPVESLMGPIKNVLDGYAAIGGTNLAIGYKGFFLSCMIAGGYVQLDDWEHDVKGFVEKPFMYVAPRAGYSLGGVMTAHFGVQYIELFGATEGKDLSAVTYGLVSNYGVEIEKFPVNFLIGTNFTPMRDLGISFEYVFSPDVKGLNAEIAYRF